MIGAAFSRVWGSLGRLGVPAAKAVYNPSKKYRKTLLTEVARETRAAAGNARKACVH